ncbi:MAG: hypothetical protein SGJ01_04275 [Gemmatimonadota bacterium]|nr:hypothetical protein [Gemmatimonadota bacterium]
MKAGLWGSFELRSWVVGALSVAIVAAPTQAQQPKAVALAALPPCLTPACDKVISIHQAALTALPLPEQAGIWIVQDADGRLLSSGVLNPFPTEISSQTYGKIVPGAAGLVAVGFGLAKTRAMNGHGPFRVVYVTRSRKADG